ncbi:MAG: EAL domain-containing protein, partial [Pseudomonadota bacterium]
KLDLVAEGVENRTQLKYLRDHGCEEVQGFIFSPAVPAADLAALLKENGFTQLLDGKPVAVLSA